MSLKTEQLFAPIEAADLSAVTLRTYQDRIRVWEKDTKKTMFHIMTHPTVYIPFLQEGRGASSTQTLKSYVSVILALYRYNPTLKEKHKKHLDMWVDLFQKTHQQIEEKYSNNTISEKQQEAYVPFADVIAKRDTLPVGSLDRLVLSMYTYIPPLRADFNRVPVYMIDDEDEDEDDMKTLLGEDAENYIVVRKKNKTGTLVLREFKTKKKMVQIENDLPEPLVMEIITSFQQHPRLHLFYDRKGEPYTAHGYTQFVNRTLKRLFQKPVTISMLRHSYINSIDFNTVTVKEREQIARMMAHSVGMQDRYRLLFKDETKTKMKGQEEGYSCRCGPLHTSGSSNA